MSRASWIIPPLLLLAVTIPHLDQGDWQRTDSGRYAAIGLQAWRTGELWTLHSEPGVPYFNKPPLALWIHGLVLHAAGVGAIQARVPTVVAAIGCVLFTGFIARRMAGASAGWVSASVLALTYEFFRRSREIALDMWQLLFMLAGLAVMVAALQRGRGGLAPFALAGLFFGLALMCKPLVALAAPLIIAAWLIYDRRPRDVAKAVAAAAVAILIAAPWHLSMWRLHGDSFLAQYFGKEIVERAGAEMPAGEGGHEPPWFYAAQVLISYWPWLPPALLGAMRRDPADPRRRLRTLAIVWFAGWFILLTLFPDRRDRYALPLYPALAMLAAMALPPEPWPARLLRARDALLRWLPPVAVVAAVVVAILPVRVQGPPNPQWEHLYSWMDTYAVSHGGRPPELWQGAFGLERGARLYLRYGSWPRTTRDRLGKFIVDRTAEPPAGALIAYHRRDGLAPGPNESELFRSGDLCVTVLGPGGWNPVAAPDPGE
jgi:4-amino-4-deoxy-L-arabinose transferase-like glycosyltransferase